nr:The knockout of this gene causes small aggregate formation in Dictyostelium; Method: conceptual translation supplied by author [Dictyostelium discoideum]
MEEIKETVVKKNKEKKYLNDYKIISEGNNIKVLPKKDFKPKFSLVSYKNYEPNLGFGKMLKLFQPIWAIDRHIKMKNPPDPFVFIKMPSSKLVQSQLKLYYENEGYKDIPVWITPCSAFMRYIKSYPIVGTVTETMEKKKGFTNRFLSTSETKASVSVGFFGCESSMEVTSGYEYEDTVTSEETRSWSQTLNEGSYIVYQNVLVYAYIIYGGSYKPYIDQMNKFNPGLNIKFFREDKCIFFVPINRDDAFTLRYQDNTWDPVEYDVLIDYLGQNQDKWFSGGLP